MNNDIKCPNCGEMFDVENVIAIELEKKFQQDYQDKLNQLYDSQKQITNIMDVLHIFLNIKKIYMD
jgi:hypothetical protein